MAITHNLGFPRFGKQRELKHALEAYWRNDSSPEALIETGYQLRQAHWQQQLTAGIDWLTVGDFAWYDHVLELTTVLGGNSQHFQNLSVDTQAEHFTVAFALARGHKRNGS